LETFLRRRRHSHVGRDREVRRARRSIPFLLPFAWLRLARTSNHHKNSIRGGHCDQRPSLIHPAPSRAAPLSTGCTRLASLLTSGRPRHTPHNLLLLIQATRIGSFLRDRPGREEYLRSQRRVLALHNKTIRSPGTRACASPSEAAPSRWMQLAACFRR
jgi:hypothetical protein